MKYKRFKESRSRSPEDCVIRTHSVFAGDWGGASTSQKNAPVPRKWFRVIFRVCGHTCIACDFYFFVILTENTDIFSDKKTGKQGIWRAICEKTPFPISSEAVFSTCWEASPIPPTLQFFAGYASSGRFEVLRFNPCINDDVMLIQC